MDFFREFGKQFTNVAKSVTEKSRDGAELARLNGEVRAAEEALEQLYARYGKACFAGYEGGDPDEIEELALRIRAARLQLEEITARRDEARELKRCMSCGAVHPKEARFCSACGRRLPENAPKPEPVEEGEYCPNCGAKLEDGAAGCPVCGARLETPDRPAPEPAPGPAPEPYSGGPDVEEPEITLE